MKRITKADINFTLDTKLIKVDDFSIKFYTINPTNFYISKNQDNVTKDGEDYVIKLDWNELVTIGEGVLEYRAINNTLDNGFVDNYYNKSVERTTEYYINSDVVVDEDEAKNYGELIAELGQEIAAEVSTRQQNVSALTDLINGEISRAASAETSLKSDIDNAENSISALTDDVNDKIYYISGVTNTKADKTQLNNYYTKAEVDAAIDDIDVSGQLKDYMTISAFTMSAKTINDKIDTKADKTALNTKVSQAAFDTYSADTVVAIENKANVDDLQEVAFSGDYNDLKNKPSVSPSLPEYWDAGEY